jgi:multicomponent Na+:H+ antiporter subunit D
VLLFASAGVFHHAGIKIPFFAFFSHDSGLRPEEPPLNMLLAMGITAFLCVFIGAFPGYLYSVLPYPVDYVPYTASHVLSQLELLFFSALAFTLLMLSGIYPAEKRAVNLDADWLYRKGARAFMWLIEGPGEVLGLALRRAAFEVVPGALAWWGRNPVAALRVAWHFSLASVSGPSRGTELRRRAREELAAYPGNVTWHWAIGTAVIWVTVILMAYLLVYYL